MGLDPRKEMEGPPPPTPSLGTHSLFHLQDSGRGPLHPLQPGAGGGADAEVLVVEHVLGEQVLCGHP